MIIEILALSLARMASYSAIITSREVSSRYNHLTGGDYSGRTNFENGRLALCQCLKRKWFHNRFWPLWWSVSLSISVQTTLNHIRFVFFITISKITKEIFVKICSQLKSTDTDLKVHPLPYANELLVRVRHSFQKLNMQKQWEKHCLGKE